MKGDMASHLTSHFSNLTGRGNVGLWIVTSIDRSTKFIILCECNILISGFTLSRNVSNGCHFYHYVLHQGLIALQTVIADRAKQRAHICRWLDGSARLGNPA
jgi:hypothetical protein